MWDYGRPLKYAHSLSRRLPLALLVRLLLVPLHGDDPVLDQTRLDRGELCEERDCLLLLVLLLFLLLLELLRGLRELLVLVEPGDELVQLLEPSGGGRLLFLQLSSLVLVGGLVSVNLVLDLSVLGLDLLLLSLQLGLLSVQSVVLLSEVLQLALQLCVIVQQLLRLLLQLLHQHVLGLEVLLELLLRPLQRRQLRL